MRAYRFLPGDRRDALTDVRWTRDWADPSIGVVAYHARDLPHWLAEELWEVELDGTIVERELSLAATRGRLVERVTSWDQGAAGDFLRWCAERFPDMGIDPDAGTSEAACCAGYVAAQAAGMRAAHAGVAYDEAERAERELQRDWVIARTGLSLEAIAAR